MVLNIIILILSYLIGSISSGLWISKIFYKTDIREHGSHNTGTTNVWRVLGAKAGLATFLFDFLKGYLPFMLAVWLELDWSPFVFGVAAIIGHVYPIFSGFKGGKAVATSAGVAFAYKPLFLFINFPLVFVITLYLTSTVSIASITAVTTALILSFFMNEWYVTLIVFIIWLFIIYRHRDNIKRVSTGNENKISWGLAYQREQKKKQK